ncbi:MAG: hypothetical protein LBU34_10435 [Planctomycetaceae bacterium]|nr:hypothetical protein [Planctomycetaceae bacterium]
MYITVDGANRNLRSGIFSENRIFYFYFERGTFLLIRIMITYFFVK